MLVGRDRALTDELAGKMERASATQQYEIAASYRDRIALLQRARGEQYASVGVADADVVAVALDAGLACFGVVSIRRGRNLGGRFMVRKNPLELDAVDLLEAFLPQNYLGNATPSEILLSDAIKNKNTLQETLSQENKINIEIKHNCRAGRARWIESARVNTAEHLRAHLTEHSQLDAQFADLADVVIARRNSFAHRMFRHLAHARRRHGRRVRGRRPTRRGEIGLPAFQHRRHRTRRRLCGDATNFIADGINACCRKTESYRI